MKLKLLNRTCRVSLVGLAIYLVLAGFLCNLGFWQLGRAEQKKDWLAAQQAAMAGPRLMLNQLEVKELAELRYRKAQVRGRYDAEHQFLLDNQVVDGKHGYFVMTPFFIEGQKQAVLVNRGWIEAASDRRVLPSVEVNPEEQEILARMNAFPGVGWRLKGAEIPTDSWPAAVQVIDSIVLSEKLGYELLPYQLELAPEAAGGYRRDWKIYSPIPPEKHIAYAVQWFALALTLSGLFFWISFKKAQ